MYQFPKIKTKIYSSGIHLPTEIVKSDDLMTEIRSEQQYNIATDWISSAMGIVERRAAPADAKPSDLAIPAAQSALDSCPEIDPQLIDLVIFCGIERDQPEPATAHTIQNALGLHAKHAFDVANACFGFIDAMQIASNYVGCGIVRYALVVTGEVPMKVTRAFTEQLKRGVDIKTAKNIIGALTVGDAGGAVLIGPTSAGEKSGFELFNTTSYSDNVDKCLYRHKADGSIEGTMMMGSLAASFIKLHQRLLRDTLGKLGWPEFDWLLSHQIGQRPFDRIGGMQGVNPNRMIKTLDKFGNVASATFPLNYHKMTSEGIVRPGDRIGGCFAGSGIVVGQFGYTY
ncbi:3-oxoacyl-ACP synthase III family protein [Arenicella xantha]|uniref:3-oxoacyl-[acyl-carrier-protein] synthase III n=1 Tax=Arenicella xantha TaxID=644221 RepID=A0A395JNT9_9GAMM|nr:3-oxoacyl-[acyl-carrier-protein] synthase III C-terminal domain-containing protein [Arenicella xantha]RBP51457.1 3-oxoacyl-[acyl-carrier-protein] synthase III [Arenicella xantha]